MIDFEVRDSQVILVYEIADSGPALWIDQKLQGNGTATLSRVFTVQEADLIPGETTDTSDDDSDAEGVRRFVVGELDGEYRRIRANVLGLKYDLLISVSIPLAKEIFVAERNISIFRRIDELIDEQIVIGGTRPNAIPEEEFRRLLREFPTSTELARYAQARITRVLREYLETMSDAEQRLASYMERRARTATISPTEPHGRIPVVNELDLEKFTYVRERLSEMLKDAESYSEAEWQVSVADLFLLIFPQYVSVLRNVHVRESYSDGSKLTDRYIDMMLVGANGCVDIIEIKKPFERSLVSKSQYRANHVPVRKLSGAIMQAEKYLFYLNKSGKTGENEIAMKHAGELPPGLEIKIANPKAIILSGRDSNLTDQEKFDFEFIRRGYSSVVDVISYDDLLRRLDNVIAGLEKRSNSVSHPDDAISAREIEGLETASE